MRRLLSLIFTCLYLLHAVGQASDSMMRKGYEKKLAKQSQKNVMPSQSLPNWFAAPKKDQYVGCSLPNEETSTHHETAILSAILNYIIFNINFGTSSQVSGTTSYNEVNSSENSVKNSKKNIFFPFDYRVVHLESDGQHTYAAVEVDTVGKKNSCFITITTNWQRVFDIDLIDQEINIDFLRGGRYTIKMYENEDKMSFALMSENTKISVLIKEKPLQNHNALGDGKLYEDRLMSAGNTDIGTVFWQATLDELLKANGSDVPWKYRNVRNYMNGNKLCVVYKPENDKINKYFEEEYSLYFLGRDHVEAYSETYNIINFIWNSLEYNIRKMPQSKSR